MGNYYEEIDIEALRKTYAARCEKNQEEAYEKLKKELLEIFNDIIEEVTKPKK